MKTRSDPETDDQFTGANRGNGGRVQRAGKTLNYPAPSRGIPGNSLRYLRFLLFNSLRQTVLALAGVPAATVTLFPAVAQAQGAI
jgi:hypothetical protein